MFDIILNHVYNLIYKYKTNQDSSHVSSFYNEMKIDSAKHINILGGGAVSDKGIEYLKLHDVDVAINFSRINGVKVKNRIFELPRDVALIDGYVQFLENETNNGTVLWYRPSKRDVLNGTYDAIKRLKFNTIKERRYTPNNAIIYASLLRNKCKFAPFYRCSIIMVVWFVFINGAKHINLFGVELSHSGEMHNTLKLAKNENAFTLLYKLWLYFKMNHKDVVIKFDDKSALGALTHEIDF